MILSISNSSTIDLEGAGVGTCRIWGWNYRDINQDDFIGLPLADLQAESCSDISENSIQVTRVDTGAPCITSTRDIESVSFLQISPNPANSIVNIEYEGLDVADQSHLSLIDVTGRTIQQIQLSQENDNIQMDITNVQSGFYYVRIKSRDKITTTKLLIVK